MMVTFYCFSAHFTPHDVIYAVCTVKVVGSLLSGTLAQVSVVQCHQLLCTCTAVAKQRGIFLVAVVVLTPPSIAHLS